MDAVRFGKALGAGARGAAKTLVQAADAATAPHPDVHKHPGAPKHPDARKIGVAAGARVQQRTTQVRAAGLGVQRGGRRFGEAVWGPFLRLSGVLWLEVTGVFFGLFVLTLGVEVWKRRADLLRTGAPREHVWFALAIALVFAYFTVSSFVRASRRGRGR